MSGSNSRRAANVTGAGLALIAVAGVRLACYGAPPEHVRLWLLLMILLAGVAPASASSAFEQPGVTWQLQIVSCLLLASFCTLGSAAAIGWVASNPPSASLVLTIAAASWGAILSCRYIASTFQKALAIRKLYVIYGANELGIALADRLARSSDEIKILGFIDETPDLQSNAPLPYPLLGGLDAWPRGPAGPDHEIYGVIIALPHGNPDHINATRLRLLERTPNVFVSPPEVVLNKDLVAEKQVGTVNCFLLGADDFSIMKQSAKRFLDILIASTALVVFAPILLLCALIVRLESDGPAIYRQKRFTRHNRLFDCYKFRTMYVAPAGQGDIELTQRNDRRVTRFGRFLRRTSLDELPQFINVLQGHMSVVGPRPHPPGVKAGKRLYEDVVPDFAERYKVKPGITGWAQVSGLRGNTFTEALLERRFRHDVQYINNWSLSLEILIIVKTVLGGFGGKNAF